MPWSEYYGGQRNAVIYGALYEGLASDPADADAKLARRPDHAGGDP